MTWTKFALYCVASIVIGGAAAFLDVHWNGGRESFRIAEPSDAFVIERTPGASDLLANPGSSDEMERMRKKMERLRKILNQEQDQL